MTFSTKWWTMMQYGNLPKLMSLISSSFFCWYNRKFNSIYHWFSILYMLLLSVVALSINFLYIFSETIFINHKIINHIKYFHKSFKALSWPRILGHTGWVGSNFGRIQGPVWGQAKVKFVREGCIFRKLIKLITHWLKKFYPSYV